MLLIHLFKNFILSQRSGALIRRISFLSIISIIISVASFFLVLFVMNGMNHNIRQRMLSLEPHLVIQFPKDLENVQSETLKFLKDDLKAHSEVFNFNYEKQDVIIRTAEGRFKGAIGYGVTHKSMAHFFHQLEVLKNATREKGSVWDAQDIPEEDEIIIGIDLARSLGVLEGDTLSIISPEGLLLPPGESAPFSKVKVRKLIETKVSDIDAQNFYYIIGKSLLPLKKSSSRREGVEVWFKNEKDNSDEFKEILKNKYSWAIVETWKDRNSELFFALKLEKFIIGLFLAIAALVAGSSILSVLALLIFQKNKEIALLKVMGLSSKKVVNVFTQMGFLLALIGIIPGIFLGVFGGYYLELNPLNILPDIYYDSQISAKVDWLFAVGVSIVVLLLSYVGAWLPAKTSEEIEMASTLRQKN